MRYLNPLKEITVKNLITLTLSLAFLFSTFISAGSTPLQMKKAVPVWAQGREKEMNLMLGFRGIFRPDKNKKCVLRITASTLYRVYLNGEFLGYGPARAAHGYYRADEYNLGELAQNDINILAIEVAGYNVNSYYTLDQPSFLQAEVEADGKILLATGSAPGFEAFQIKEKVQKIERYSFQRPFTEYYRMKSKSGNWKMSASFPLEIVKLENLPPVNLLPRHILLPDFKVTHPESVIMSGSVSFSKPEKYRKDRSLTKISDKLKGFPEDELEVIPSMMVQEIVTHPEDTIEKPYSGSSQVLLSKNKFCSYDLGVNLSGFIEAKISCAEPSTVMFCFDEILSGGDVYPKKHMPDVNNQIVYELEPGAYNLESFESYTFRYLKIIVLKGNCQIHDVSLREYAYPENKYASFSCSNPKLEKIFKAAQQTFRQNAVDLFMDCPSRERAGWLCDSYFSSIMEKDFTGNSDVARNFYENYALPARFDYIPEGMVPMCYPADHNDGVFIPNWAMWFVIQVADYARRGGDPVLVASLKPRVEGILNYFARFENKDGLLENLESWIFVEWSKANSFVRDVNYPTNMLYSAVLSNAAGLYHNEKWKEKSERIKQTVLKQSYNGAFFVDNADRNKEGKLEVTSNTTEVCQYYAFFFNIATPETHPGLWKKLVTEFGPKRNDKTTYPEVFRANAFVGNYLRMDILSRYGLENQLVNEIQDYFYKMAQRTGTLWENMETNASCNHGFASYLGHVLYRDVLGISQIDYINKKITIQFTNTGLTECEGKLPVGNSFIGLNWKRSGNQIFYSLKTPHGFNVDIENRSSCELVRQD